MVGFKLVKTTHDLNVGDLVKLTPDHKVDYFVKEIINKFLVHLEYKNASGKMVSGGIMDVTLIMKKKGIYRENYIRGY